MTPQDCAVDIGETVIGTVNHNAGTWLYRGELLGVAWLTNTEEVFVLRVDALKAAAWDDWLPMHGSPFGGRGDLRAVKFIEPVRQGAPR